jgi:hypothetical protein
MNENTKNRITHTHVMLIFKQATHEIVKKKNIKEYYNNNSTIYYNQLEKERKN